MSLKFAATKTGRNRYILPKTGTMRCDVTAFLSDDLFASSDEGMWKDAYVSASFPGATGMYLMPDCHQGYVLPVGGVLVTEDTILQAGSGYDIGCGVLHLRVPGLHARDIASWDVRTRWVEKITSQIDVGFGKGSGKVGGQIDMEEVYRYGVKAVGGDESLCERAFIPVGVEFDSTQVESATKRSRSQLGSIGSGNHFWEIQVDQATGEVWIMIHCGSRGFGWQAANHFYKAGAELRGIPYRDREKSWLRLDEPLGRSYWAWHNAAANYAVANRHLLAKIATDITQDMFGTKPELFYEISHNLVQEETLVLPDGSTKKGFVHRKGSTRAFPAGHPDLVGTRWADTGHPCLIPGSMLTGAAILQPLPGAYGSGCSVNHGSGRQMGREEAKRVLGSLQNDIDREMREVRQVAGGVEVIGIVSNCPKTPLDECGHAYKPLDSVLNVLEQEGIAKVLHRLWPVANIKGMD